MVKTFFAILVGIFTAIASAGACSFAAPARIGVAAIPVIYPNADAVVIAFLSKERSDGYAGTNRYDAKIEEIWKGDLVKGESIVVTTRTYSSNCDVELRPPARMVMFLVQDGNAYRLDIFSAIPNISNVYPDAFKEVVEELDRFTKTQR